MNKKIEDYLHLYIGCPIWDSYNEKKGILFGIDWNKSGYDNVKVLHKHVWDLKYSDVKPILRSIADMTEKEMEELWHFIFRRPFGKNGSIKIHQTGTKYERRVLWSGVERLGIEVNGHVWADSDLLIYKYNHHEVTRWLLSRQFDIFGLIESGLAIDATKLPKENITHG